MLRYRQSSDIGNGGKVSFNSLKACIFIAVMSCRHLVINHADSQPRDIGFPATDPEIKYAFTYPQALPFLMPCLHMILL